MLGRLTALFGAFFVFFLLRSLYAPALAWLTGNGFLSAGGPIADRLLYGFFFPGTGSIFFLLVLPALGAGSRPILAFKRAELSLKEGVSVSLLAAALLFGAAYAMTILSPHRTPPPSTEGLFLILFSSGILTPIFEETFFRGLFQEFLISNRMAPPLSIAFAALAFASIHFYFVAPFLAIAGLVFGALNWRYGLYASLAAHAAYNLAILSIGSVS